MIKNIFYSIFFAVYTVAASHEYTQEIDRLDFLACRAYCQPVVQQEPVYVDPKLIMFQEQRAQKEKKPEKIVKKSRKKVQRTYIESNTFHYNCNILAYFFGLRRYNLKQKALEYGVTHEQLDRFFHAQIYSGVKINRHATINREAILACQN